MNDFLQEERFNFVSPQNKTFILAFDQEMARLGYDFGAKIGSGYCWGRYMLIYRKSGVKSEKVYARIYLRDADIVLRLFLNEIDEHRAYIEAAPQHIRDVFCGPTGDCQHCKNEKQGWCKFRKTYTLDGRFIEKCNGVTFEFLEPSVDRLTDYVSLFSEFYARKRKPL
jgi:hypothetical protein